MLIVDSLGPPNQICRTSLIRLTGEEAPKDTHTTALNPKASGKKLAQRTWLRTRLLSTEQRTTPPL